MPDVTYILSKIEQGDPKASEQLLPLVYEELRKLAARKMVRENPGQTLQATALVHEAYIRLVDTDRVERWDSRGHFFAAAAEAMRRILVENARRKQSLKAGGAFTQVDLDAEAVAIDSEADDLLVLDDALTKLAREDGHAAELAKLRLFAGLTVAEAAASLGMSRTTGYGQWTYARAYLQAEMLADESQREK